MAKTILIGYDGPGNSAAVVKCLHFADADDAIKYRANDTECFRFLTLRNPAGIRKANENYRAATPAADPAPDEESAPAERALTGKRKSH